MGRLPCTLAGVADEETHEAYRAAYQEWQVQLERLHALLLDGERLPPDQVKGLLNRESRAKERYEKARRRLLGIEA